MLKNLLAKQKTPVLFLGREHPLGKEMAIHSSILAYENPTDRGAWWAIVYGVAKSQTQLSDKTAVPEVQITLILTLIANIYQS